METGGSEGGRADEGIEKREGVTEYGDRGGERHGLRLLYV